MRVGLLQLDLVQYRAYMNGYSATFSRSFFFFLVPTGYYSHVKNLFIRAIESPDRLQSLISAYCTSCKMLFPLPECLTPHFAHARIILFTSVSVSARTWRYKTPCIRTRDSPSVSPSRLCFLIILLTRSLVQYPTHSLTPTLFTFFILKRCCPSPKLSLSPRWPSAHSPRPSRSSKATPASVPATRTSSHAAIRAARPWGVSSLM